MSDGCLHGRCSVSLQVSFAPLLTDPIDALCKKCRVDLPLPTRFVLMLGEFRALLLPIVSIAMLGTVFFYFVKIAKDRTRIRAFNAVIGAVAILWVLGLLFSLIAPFIKTVDRL
jgi:hypothetical protein